jgi:L-serine dehydratase
MHSVLELFKIGLGPSSSHTTGPMVAARLFAEQVAGRCRTERRIPRRVVVDLYGSLALTGKGHATDRAVVGGLSGLEPHAAEPADLARRWDTLQASGRLTLLGGWSVEFTLRENLIFHMSESLPEHPNGLRLRAWLGPEAAADTATAQLLPKSQLPESRLPGAFAEPEPEVDATYFSVGGGFVVSREELAAEPEELSPLPFPFESAAQLLQRCQAQGWSIAQLVRANELTWRSETELEQSLDHLWDVMQESIRRGCETEGELPGGLGIRRRAAGLYHKLTSGRLADDPLQQLDWASLCALAVNEENAAGGRVVTAPTNGAAGVIPAVLSFHQRFDKTASRRSVHDFLLTAGAIGLLYKRNASLSAAEMGCQGEVGVACSMAAAGLAACLGGSVAQVENAAEIGMEHNLGLTCDPIAGLVQVPCIERNTMGAVKAINAARLAVLYGDGRHRVSLDRVIETMRQTGRDMQTKYKETSLGGLAVNVVDC